MVLAQDYQGRSIGWIWGDYPVDPKHSVVYVNVQETKVLSGKPNK